MKGAILIAAAALLLAATAPHAHGSLLVVNQGNATVSVVDPATDTIRATIDEHQPGKVRAHELAVSPDGRTAYLPIYGDAGVGKPGVNGRQMLLVDIARGAISSVVDFGDGVRPHHAVVEPRSGLVYVTNELSARVAIVDPVRGAVIGTIPTGAAQSHMLAISHDGRFGYTANVADGSISVLDLKGRTLLGQIKVADGVQRIAISPDDRFIFTSDTERPRLAMIDTRARSVHAWINLPSTGYGAAATSDGRFLLVTLPHLNELAVIDISQSKVAQTIPVGQAPQEVLIQPDGRRAFVSCAGDGVVSVVDLERWQPIATIATGPGADGLAWSMR